MDQRHPRAGAVEREGGFGGRIPGADHRTFLPVVGCALGEVVGGLRQFLAGNVQHVGRIEIAGGDHHVPGTHGVALPAAPAYTKREVPPLSFHLHHLLVLPHVQVEMFDYAAIIFQSLATSRLVAGRHEGHIAELQLLGGAEEGAVGGIQRDRTRHRTLVEEHALHPCPARRDANRQAARAGADYRDLDLLVQLLHAAPG